MEHLSSHQTATIVSIWASPSETIVPIAAYSAQIEHGAEHSISIFTPEKILLFLVFRTAATVDIFDFLLLIRSFALSTSSKSCFVKLLNLIGTKLGGCLYKSSRSRAEFSLLVNTTNDLSSDIDESRLSIQIHPCLHENVLHPFLISDGLGIFRRILSHG